MCKNAERGGSGVDRRRGCMLGTDLVSTKNRGGGQEPTEKGRKSCK